MREGLKNLGVAAAFFAVLAVGVWQGGGIDRAREAERFYRWLNSMTGDIFIQQDQDAARALMSDLSLASQVTDAATLGAALTGGGEHPLASARAHAAAAATATRAATAKAARPRDYEIFERAVMKTEALLGGVDDTPRHSRLVALISEGGHEDQIWDLVSGDLLREEREEFLTLFAQDRLEFTRGVDWAQAQSSGVNLFNLFFGFRQVAANFVWLQVDKFWHMGMEHRMIPLMRTTVALDPNFVDAYLVGAWHLAYNITAKMGETPPEEKRWLPGHEAFAGDKEAYYYSAIEYLQDGIRNNPREYRLYFDAGYSIYHLKLNDHNNAVKYLERAVSMPHERWVPRQLYHCYELNGQFDKAQTGWETYQRRYPENVTAPRAIERNKARKIEARADRYMERAGAQELDADSARQWREMALELYREARAEYREIDESFAEARATIVEAKMLAEERRFVEAIALLEYARLSSNQVFLEASDYIIEYKQEAGIPLALTEQMELERRRDIAQAQARARAQALAAPQTTAP